MRAQLLKFPRANTLRAKFSWHDAPKFIRQARA
jgi:hypothetical protein